jgi:hypothetical protein
MSRGDADPKDAGGLSLRHPVHDSLYHFTPQVQRVIGSLLIQEKEGRLHLRRTYFMVGFERIYGHHANLFRAILAHVSDPNKLPMTCQIGPRLGQRSTNQLEQRLFSKNVRVVLILVAARYLKDALPYEGD